MSRRQAMIVVLLLYSAFRIPNSALADEVEWRRDYPKARQEAAEKGRPLLLDFGTQYCHWCKQLDLRTFRDPAVVEALNRRFVPLKIDAQKDAALAEALRVQSFPTLVFAAPDGKILATHEGFLESARLLDLLQRAQASAAKQVESQSDPRARRARELLAQAREDRRGGQFLCCLERCEALAAGFADLPEAAQALQLAGEIKDNPEWMKQACEGLSDRLGTLYLELAETWLRRGQPNQAVLCLERVLQTCPGTRHADAAQVRLSQVQGQPSQAVELHKP